MPTCLYAARIEPTYGKAHIVAIKYFGYAGREGGDSLCGIKAETDSEERMGLWLS